MGLVYEGRHRDIDKSVAIKVLRSDLSRRPEVVARFRQEAKSASCIGHENIVDVSDFGETRYGASYFVMEYLEGEDLANVLGREVTLDESRACAIVLQCCRALAAAHEKQIVHRDIKPENIFLTTRDGQRDFVKIVDFGIAKMSDIETEGQPDRKLTKTGMIFGTPEYMSPEQAAGKELDHRVDVYALGIILYECLAGTVPFVGDTFMGVLTQHLFSDPPAVREANTSQHVSPELELVIHKALAKEPDDRYQDTGELAEAIEYALAGQVSPKTPTQLLDALDSREVDTLPGPPPKPGRWWGLAVATGTAALLWAWIGWGADQGASRAESPIGAGEVAAVGSSSVRAAPTARVPRPALVDLHVASSPEGARVYLADGTEMCASTPCSFETASGTPVSLRAKLGRRIGRTQITPVQEETVLIELKEPKKPASKPRNAAGAKPRSTTETAHQASDLKVPEWAR